MNYRIVNFDRDEEVALARTQRNAWRWSAFSFALALLCAIAANVGTYLDSYATIAVAMLGVLILTTAAVIIAVMPQFHRPRETANTSELDSNPFTHIRKP